MVKCGAAETVITPRLGTYIPGYFIERVADDILDDLYARAVVFDDGEKTAGIVVLDVMHVPAEVVRKIRGRISEYGIDGANIMVAATHTHTGTAVSVTRTNDYCDIARQEDVDQICARAADAVYLAYRRRKEAKIGFGAETETEVSFNRRWWMKDGKVHTWPGISNPDSIAAAAGIDPEVGVVRIDDLEGKTIAVLINFANHPDTVTGCAYSGDYIGALCKKMHSVLGEQVISVFMNGCCGDITHIDYTGEHPVQKNHRFFIAERLADDVLRAYGKIHTEEMENIDACSQTVTIARRQFTEEEYKAAKREVEEIMAQSSFRKPTAGNKDRLKRLAYASSAVKLYENPILSKELEVQAIRVGDIAFSFMPGEILVEIGLELKKKSPFSKNFVVELANGNGGYIAPKKAISEGGYEVTRSMYVNLCEDAADIINETLLTLLNKIQ